MNLWCDDERDHRRQAREDFSRRGSYGYDRERYGDRWDDCNRAYTEEFDRARRDDDRRREERDEQEARERRATARAAQERNEEEAYYQQQQQQTEQPGYTVEDECESHGHEEYQTAGRCYCGERLYVGDEASAE